ncbi:unnamed protein product [Medioppia subpectinata]|uniref:Protein FAM98A n=1 Tax=Medioppia subpectinata TaxID=1979941 RepID=A0A7R9KN88_9ACAR|nr:unnamed protein product [Medioppia subpectinata]CAG2106645.1 unnamed protein product [Medioppia subpectinata]
MSDTTLSGQILDSLQDLDCPHFSAIEKDVSLLTHLHTFSAIISWISTQLQTIRRLESVVNPIKDASESMSLKIELNSLLRELKSPLIDLSFTDNENKLAILNSLCGHLMASRMDCVNQKSTPKKSMTISPAESQTAKDLKSIVITLGMGRPPDSVTSAALFKRIHEKLVQRLSDQKLVIEDSLLLPEGLTLSPDQWKNLETITEELKKDYTIRREMLLRRCDCTVGSFKWKSDMSSDATKAIEKQINDKYESERGKLTNTPNVVLASALAARESDCDILLNCVVSHKTANCLIQVSNTSGLANRGLQQRQPIHKHMIGSVPDRGGRPNEQIAPPKESFSQQQFQRDNPQRGRGRGGNAGGGGSRGGGGYNRGASAPNVSQNTSRVQGSGWTQNTGQRYSTNPSANSYSYADQRGGGYQQNDRQQYYQQNDRQSQQPQQQQYQQRSDSYNSGQYSQQSYGQQYGSQYQTNQFSNQSNDRQSYNNNNYDNTGSYYSDKTYYSGGNRGRGGGGRRY